jgi:two-component SAPR family response regulator
LAVLVFLAVHAEGATSTELAAALWPQPREGSVTNRIYNVISAVHQALDPAKSAPTILRDGERYRLNPQRIDVDLWRLHEAIRAAAEPTTRATALRRVVDTYVGDLADGWPWPWLDPHREATRRQVLDAYAALAADQPEAAVQLLHAAALVDPVNDELRRRIFDTDPQGTGGDVAGSR